MTWKDAQCMLQECNKKKEGMLRKEWQEYPKMSLDEICKGIVRNSESDIGESPDVKRIEDIQK